MPYILMTHILVHAIRYMKMELRHLTFINPELDGGNVCPACPKVCVSL